MERDRYTKTKKKRGGGEREKERESEIEREKKREIGTDRQKADRQTDRPKERGEEG